MNSTNLINAQKDIMDGLTRWPVWMRLALIEVKERYRRSTLGGFWITLSTLVMVLIFGILYGKLFNQDLSTHVLYVAAGLIFWQLYSEILINGCTIFIQNANMIKKIRLPKSIFLFQMACHETIVFVHNFLIVVAIYVLQLKLPGLVSLAFIPGLILLVIQATSLGLVFGIVATRYRDFPPIIQAITRPMMFLTPIIWHADMFPKKAFFIEWNPIYHLIEICRSPLIGEVADPFSWYFALVLTGLSIVSAYILLARYRHRISYWV